MASFANPFSVSSASTPSMPILSSLSNVMHTLSNSFSAKPICINTARNSLLSFNLTLKFFMPIACNAFVVVKISSISESLDSEPIISISHWINSLNLPFCGRSARYTRSIWIHFIGSVSLSLLFA